MEAATRRFPYTRIYTIDSLAIAKDKHHIGALLELDVTDSRRRLRRLRAGGGQPVSFLGWALKCLSQAIREYPEACAIYLPKRRLLLLPTIDLNVVVEREVQGQRVPLPVVIRDAGSKSMAQLSAEVLRAQEEPLSEQIVLGAGRARFSERLYCLLPAWLRRIALRRVLRRPESYRSRMGAVSVTSVGMFGKVNGWFLPLGFTPLIVGLGTITRKPWAHENAVQLRDVLHLSLLMDHDVMDGAPMARFVARLSELLETSWGLPTGEPAQAERLQREK
jgi:pyruvate/2-oxoglutarate dehydrogenase complex dihydrolipoamide acyltransferase (E2) component